MTTFLTFMITYFIGTLMMEYFFSKTFGEKYSFKVTFLGTIALWMGQCIAKLMPMLLIGTEILVYCNSIVLIFSIIYVVVLFEKSVANKILALVVLLIVQSCMDILGMNLTGILLGNYNIYQLDSNYNTFVAWISTPLIVLGTFLLTKIWNVVKEKKLEAGKYQWLCVILPISQYLLMWRIALIYVTKGFAIPLFAALGVIIGIFADIYMLFLFYQSNKRVQAEKELEDLQHQYALEQLRYEQLKEGQEETAKMRHDFQNYILMMRQME